MLVSNSGGPAMQSVHRIWRLIGTLAIAAGLCQGDCVPNNSPDTPNQDPVARLLKAQARCPTTALEFRTLVEGSGARLETTMVNFLGFHNPGPGALFLFEIASSASIQRGDLLFGHFLTSSGSRLVLSTGGLLVEAIAWDPAKQLFNFYELLQAGGQPRWFYRGDSQLVFEDISLLYRQRAASQRPFKERLRCSGCHVHGGLVQKEFVSPHNDWWLTSRKLPLGRLTPDPTVAKIFTGLTDGSELAKLVDSTTRRLFSSPTYRKMLQSATMQEQLRPLFCPVELNIESDPDPFDDKKALVQIPAGFFADPRLGAASVSIARADYEQALTKFRSRMAGPSKRTDADHPWLTPVKASSDIRFAEALVDMGVVDNEFVADVLAVDFTNPVFSPSRCGLLKQVPAAGGPDFLVRFQAALKSSSDPAAKTLLSNLTDPKRDAAFHRQQVTQYLDACQKRAATRQAALDWFSVLAQRRAEVDRLEFSQHTRGHILESPDRVVFPSATPPGTRADLTPACALP